MWSYMRVDEPILVTRIDVFWGGYDRATSGRHFIAKVDPNNRGRLQGFVALSGIVSVSQGRAWRSANISEVLLEPGHYAVGIWGDFLGRRTAGIWNSRFENVTYVSPQSAPNAWASGTHWSPGHGKGYGVIPCSLVYEPAGRARVRAGGVWRTGKGWARSGGVWRKAKAVWVKANGVWRRGK